MATAVQNWLGQIGDELVNGEIFYSLAEAKVLIEAWRHHNTVRPPAAWLPTDRHLKRLHRLIRSPVQLWTKELSLALRTGRRLQAGYIWVTGIAAYRRGVPLGGCKNNGVGRERGLEEPYAYTEEKSLQIFIQYFRSEEGWTRA